MDKEYVILGGGVAGLCAAIRLVELGIRPLLIEGGNYPAHKVCGEFFSPSSMALLKQWNIHPLKIHEVQYHTKSKSMKYRFHEPAGSLSHLTFDPLLVERTAGATILTNTKVTQWEMESDAHILTLGSGEQIRAANLIVATGRIPSSVQGSEPPVKPVYKGIKAHFEGEIPHGILHMYLFEGAYAGISPIENGKFNVACLCREEEFAKHGSADKFIEFLRSQNAPFDAALNKGKCLFSEWMTVSAPEFGIRNTPDRPHTYFIGDAASSIPPATGNGLTLAIKSGTMAAEYAARRDYKGFKETYNKSISSTIRWGRALNIASMRTWMAEPLLKLAHSFPAFADFIFKKTH